MLDINSALTLTVGRLEGLPGCNKALLPEFGKFHFQGPGLIRALQMVNTSCETEFKVHATGTVGEGTRPSHRGRDTSLPLFY